MSHYISEMQRTVIKVTEWRNGMVWKTKEVGRVWLENVERTVAEENAIAKEHGGDMLGSMSTSDPYDQWQRSRKID